MVQEPRIKPLKISVIPDSDLNPNPDPESLLLRCENLVEV